MTNKKSASILVGIYCPKANRRIYLSLSRNGLYRVKNSIFHNSNLFRIMNIDRPSSGPSESWSRYGLNQSDMLRKVRG